MKAKMAKLPSEIISLDLHFKCDLEQFSVDYFGYALTLFDSYNRHGVLPYPGSLSEQPNKIIEIFHILEQLKLEREQKLQEEQQKQAARNNRKKK